MFAIGPPWQGVLADFGVTMAKITYEGYDYGYIILDGDLYRGFCRGESGIFVLEGVGFILLWRGALLQIFNEMKSPQDWRLRDLDRLFYLDLSFPFNFTPGVAPGAPEE
jgi:hypothetical protein